MITALLSVFIIGYLAIVFEEPLHINKTASALICGILCWVVLMVFPPAAGLETQLLQHASPDGADHLHHFFETSLGHHLIEIAEILFFLLGAMTIVELVDAHNGFEIVTQVIRTRSLRKLIWLLSGLAFILSALLDNLTTSIVMVSLLRKLVKDPNQRLFFAGMIVIAANAGGAWSPIGDVTTTMLWIGGQISAGAIISSLILPSLVCAVVPLIIVTFSLKGEAELPTLEEADRHDRYEFERNVMFFTGLGGLIFVPIFKTLTHLPPYMGMLLSLGLIWLVSEILHSSKDTDERKKLTAAYALSKIDTPSILFFMGILLAISALQTVNLLNDLAGFLDNTIGNLSMIVSAVGVLSAIIDNVPLMAAAMGMYSIKTFPQDSALWHYLAYCSGTGGSLLIIGSAAGVAVMGMEKISFVWYLKRMTLLALAGYVAGALVYLAMNGGSI